MTSRSSYDVIVVGARAAGAATALLLARRGLRVLALDRAAYGSDTLSTHALMRPAVMLLNRWGVLDEVRASGAPPIRRVTFHYPDEHVPVDLAPSDGVDALFAPRRSVLDRLLVDAARNAGAEVRFGVIVDDLQKDESGRVVGVVARDELGHALMPRADLVVGADGIRSVVALAARAQLTQQAGAGSTVVYGYYRNIEATGFEWFYAPGASAGLIPTNDDELCVFVGGPMIRFRTAGTGLTGRFGPLLDEAFPDLAARLRAGRLSARLRGFGGVVGYYRRPFGPGWALVGDAGHFRDPITTHGISDAFRDAECIARVLDGTLTFAQYEDLRNSVTAVLFALTERIASYDWTMEEIRVHLRGVSSAMRAEMDVLREWEAPVAA